MAKSNTYKSKGEKSTTAKENDSHEPKRKGLVATETDNAYKPTGKCKKALLRLSAIYDEVEKIKRALGKAQGAFRGIIKKEKEFVSSDIKDINVCSEFLGELKNRSMIWGEDVLKRLEFKYNQIVFYIDFTVVASERNDVINIQGSIIYGSCRTLCFTDCIDGDNSKKGKLCKRISRCDGLEDKPLISFEVTQHGMITSSGKLEGEWWIEDRSDLVELHYRTLDFIWKEALDWANEIIVP